MASSNRAIGLSLTLMACVLLAGCGAFSKASDCPSPATRESAASNPVTAGPSRQPQPQQTTPQKDTYSFGLALGDRSAAGSWADQAVYEALTRKDCKAASAVLVNKDGDPGDRPGWGDFDDPRQVLLFQAGYEQLCGKASKARDFYNMVKAKWGGWGGIGWASTDRSAPGNINDAILSWHTCEMYRQVASVIEQKSAGSFKCSYVNSFPNEVGDWQKWGNVNGVDKRWDPRGAKPAAIPSA